MQNPTSTDAFAPKSVGLGSCGPNSLSFRFGDCFGRNTRTSKAPWGANGEISRHKFYLAFENSIHCNDYISEKFWRNALSSGAVPVVYGLGF